MRKTILTLAMMLMMALAATAAPTIKATPASKAHVAMKGDSVVVTDGDKSVTVSGLDLQKVNEKINEALDDTLTSGGTTVEFDGHKGELAPEDIKEISNQWASVAKQWAISGSFCLLGLVALVLLFRFLNRRNKYRVIEQLSAQRTLADRRQAQRHLCAAARRHRCSPCAARPGARGYAS